MKLTSRRTPPAVLVLTAALAVTACTGLASDPPASGFEATTIRPLSFATGPSGSTPSAVAQDFAGLEKSYDTRLGVFVLDTGSGRTVTWRSDERFAFASTIKVQLSAAVLDNTSRRDLSRVIRFDEEDLVPYSPITEANLDDGMTLRDVIDAALRYSDNTAANLLFEEIGGPTGLDRALNGLGDRVTEPARIEPDLNTAIPGDARDTTTPRAMTKTLQKYVLGDALPRYDRELLRTLMVNNTTGDELIRAGLPDSWSVADKTGSADYGVRNDVAVAFPPGRAPILIVVMTSRDRIDDPYDNAVVADAARIAVGSLK